VPFTQGVALGYLILPFQGNCNTYIHLPCINERRMLIRWCCYSYLDRFFVGTHQRIDIRCSIRMHKKKKAGGAKPTCLQDVFKSKV
jgi:hypothetical protein